MVSGRIGWRQYLVRGKAVLFGDDEERVLFAVSDGNYYAIIASTTKCLLQFSEISKFPIEDDFLWLLSVS